MSNQQSIKSIIDGSDMESGEFDWQEFVLGRIKKMESSKIEELLEQVGNDELSDHLRDAITKGEYEKYNCGFFYGFKLAIMLEKSWRGDMLRY